MSAPTSTFHLRELPASFGRMLGYWFAQFVLMTLGGLLVAAASIPLFMVLEAASVEGASPALSALGLLPAIALFALSVAAPWIIIRMRFRFGGARLAFVRESLLDAGKARSTT